MHCVLQKLVAVFLMLKNTVGLIAHCNPFALAMSVIKRLFMYLIYFNITSLKRPEARDVIIFISMQLNACRKKSKTLENNGSLAPVQRKTITEACEA